MQRKEKKINNETKSKEKKEEMQRKEKKIINKESTT